MALVLRGSYHIYYGPGVVGILVWAALFYWIYLRTRNLILLMVCHAGWDAVGFLSQRWPAWPAAPYSSRRASGSRRPITWLVERNGRRQSGPVARSGSAPTPPWQPACPAGMAARPRRHALLAMVGRAALDRLRLRPVTARPIEPIPGRRAAHLDRGPGPVGTSRLP